MNIFGEISSIKASNRHSKLSVSVSLKESKVFWCYFCMLSNAVDPHQIVFNCTNCATVELRGKHSDINRHPVDGDKQVAPRRGDDAESVHCMGGICENITPEPMSIDEIKQMVQDVMQLESRQLNGVIEIVKNNEPWLIASHASDQIELNFAEMADPTLRQLQSFTAVSLKNRVESPKRGAFTVHSNEPMSTNEIRRLTQDLNQLRGYRLDGVIQIIRSNERRMRHWHPNEESSGKQVSLGKLRPRTLRKIRWYLEFSEDFALI